MHTYRYLLVFCLSSSLGAMEVPNPAFCLSYSSEVTPSPVMSHGADLFENLVGYDPVKDLSSVWSNLLIKAPAILRKGTVQDQDAYFNEVIEATIAVLSEPSLFLKLDIDARQLAYMAVFFKHEKMIQSNESMWVRLASLKKESEQFDVADRDTTLTLRKCFFKPRNLKNEELELSCYFSKEGLKNCITYLNEYASEPVLLRCCYREQNHKNVCDVCARRVKKYVTDCVQQLVVGFHKFGLTVQNKEQRDLVKWAWMYPSLSKKAR